MKYIFFFKRIVDIDHLLPIAYSLIFYSKIDFKDIIFVHIESDQTIDYKNLDIRIEYLESLGIKIIYRKSNFI